jgi:ribosomal protein S6--L-glutamate ligase
MWSGVTGPMNSARRLRLAFLLKPEQPDGKTPRVSPLTEELVARLRGRGAHVDLIVPELAPLDVADIRPAHDLYVLKEKSPLILSLAAALTMAGAVTVNSFRSCSLARDKIAATALLAAGGVPVPPSWATGGTATLRPLLDDGPFWVKDPRGSRGAGVLRVTTSTALDSRHPHTDVHGLPLPLFAQRDVPSEGGRDLKVFVVAEAMWAIARTFPARTLAEKFGTPVPVRADVGAAALAAGQALGLELYGVDFLETAGSFFAVDVNAFPGYKGAPEATQALADYLYHRAQRAANGCNL